LDSDIDSKKKQEGEEKSGSDAEGDKEIVNWLDLVKKYLSTVVISRTKACQRESTPKRLKTSPPESPNHLSLSQSPAALQQANDSAASHVPGEASTNVFLFEGLSQGLSSSVSGSFFEGLSLQTVISTMEQDATVIGRVGKVPRQTKSGQSKKSGNSWNMLKVEFTQPLPQPMVHLISWGDDADRWQARLLEVEDKVVKIAPLKYVFNHKFEEHQLQLTPQSLITKVVDAPVLEAFANLRVHEVPLAKIVDLPQYGRTNCTEFSARLISFRRGQPRTELTGVLSLWQTALAMW
jgi:hypothetical protein